MARFSYDVNTRTRLIDVYKQFNRGLKTVDTDDALGSVFLRQAENVSLSEYGFIEKRYGTIQKEIIKQTSGTLQGFWEYEGFSIYVVDNKFYYNNASGSSIPISAIFKETEDAAAPSTIYGKDWRYPSDLSGLYGINGFGAATDSNPYRDMGAVNINNVLYVFTGFYPVYIKIVSGAPRVYWFSVTVPTYDEIVVTGHNLLEDDYNTAYKYTTTQTGSMSPDSTLGGKNKINSIKFNPSIPFVVDEDGNEGSVEFNVDYTLVSNLAQNYGSGGLADKYKRLSLKSVGFRRSGSGATTFTPVDITDVDFEDIDNANDTTVRETLDGGLLTNKLGFVSSNLTRTVVNVPNLYMHEYDVEITYNLLKSAMTAGDDAVIQIFKDTGDANNPFDKILFTELNSGPSASSVPIITITPKDSNGNAFTTSAVTLSSSDITTTNDHYLFTIPSTLSVNDSIESYDIVFEHYFQDRTVSTNNTAFNYEFTNFSHTLAYVKELSSVRNFSNTVGQRPLIDFSITDLLAGTYDFEITYELKEYISRDDLFELHSSETFSGIAYEVPITAEKLQDIPGQTDDFLPKAKPIWSCNKVMEHYGKLLVWGSEDETNGMPTAVFYSFPDRPTYFPSKFYLDFTNDENEKIEAVTPYMNILVAQTASKTWGIRGNSGLVNAPAPYTPFSINGTVGTIAYKSVRPVRNHLFFLSKQGIIALKSLYAADEQYNIEFVDRNIRNIVPQDSNAVGIQFDNQYWLNFPLLNSDKESITLRWYIDKKAWVKDAYQGYATDGFNGVFKYQIVDGKLEFISHPSETADVNNLTIYRIGVDYHIPTDLFRPISAKFETSFLNQNYPFHPKNYKEAKLDFTLQNEYNLGRDAIYDSTRDSAFSTQGGGGASTVSFNLPQALNKNHRYRIEFTMNSGSSVVHLPVDDVSIEGQSSYSSGLTPVGTPTCDVDPETNTTEALCTAAGGTWALRTLIWEFNITNDYQQETAIDIQTDFTTQDAEEIDSIVVRDVTYDDSLSFSTYVISEDRTLNFDNSPGYDQATADVDVDLTLKGRLGDWTFGTSDFGKKTTAVKTIKLSGKGYNAKLYVEDVSKSKWTLESLGITYKMKRARSR